MKHRSPDVDRTDLPFFRHTIGHHLTTVTLFADRTHTGIRLRKVAFGKHSHCFGLDSEESRDTRLREWGERIGCFLSGTERHLGDIPVCLEGYTVFQRTILLAARTIPWGTTVSYRDLAQRAGHPGTARAVGSVMRSNDFPLIIPCHRVVRSDGSIGGFSGDTQGLWVELKRALLHREAGEIPGDGTRCAGRSPARTELTGGR